jgi:hypothetical protein
MGSATGGIVIWYQVFPRIVEYRSSSDGTEKDAGGWVNYADEVED